MAANPSVNDDLRSSLTALEEDAQRAWAEHFRSPAAFRDWQAQDRLLLDNYKGWRAPDPARFLLTQWPAESWPRPDPGEKPHSVAICGKDPWLYMAPWGEPGWEFWGLNDAMHVPPLEAHTRWFQLHPPRYLRKHYPRGLDDLAFDWSTDRGVRLYMDRVYSQYPNSEPFPKREVEALTPHGRYHASSFDWMLGLAILEGFQHIALCGVAFFTPPILNGEPVSARPCLEYWMGVAEGRGIKVEVTGMGDVLQIVHLARLTSDLQYGWDHEPGLDLAHETGVPWRDLR